MVCSVITGAGPVEALRYKQAYPNGNAFIPLCADLVAPVTAGGCGTLLPHLTLEGMHYHPHWFCSIGCMLCLLVDAVQRLGLLMSG